MTKKKWYHLRMKKISVIKNKKFVIYPKKSSDDDDKKYHKVTDHSYYTRKYRGGAHNICNLSTKRDSCSIS